MSQWPTGAHVVERMIADGDLEEVLPSPQHAGRLLTEARAHLRTSGASRHDDPSGSFATLYTAARKAMTAPLATVGLRPTRKGGHVAVGEAVEAMLGQAKGVVRPFNRLRRLRRDAEYPSEDTPPLGPDDIDASLEDATDIVDSMTAFVETLDTRLDR